MGKKVERRTWFTNRQEQFLRLVGENKELRTKYYLTGGTALSACYYNHRFSEDLDLFTREPIVYSEIANFIFSTKSKLGWSRLKRTETNPNGFELLWNDGDSLKIDFVYYAFPPLKKGIEVFGVKIDSIQDICANKIETILLRCKARDYVDFYTILKNEKLSLESARELHRRKHEIEIGDIKMAKAFLKVNELEEWPTMKDPFNKDKMIKFYENLAKSLETKIFK